MLNNVDDPPLAQASRNSQKILDALLSAIQLNDHGVHVESAICAAGALSGYACQASVREQLPGGGIETLPQELLEIRHENVFVSDKIRNALFASEYSLRAIVEMATVRLGDTFDLDVDGAYRNAIAGFDSKGFGELSVPAEHQPHELPQTYICSLWPNLITVLRECCPNPDSWPLVFGLVGQKLMIMARNRITPSMASRLFMESAISMSMLELTVPKFSE